MYSCRMMKLQGLVLSLLFIQGGQAFNAYDCLDPDVTASTIDLQPLAIGDTATGICILRIAL